MAKITHLIKRTQGALESLEPVANWINSNPETIKTLTVGELKKLERLRIELIRLSQRAGALAEKLKIVNTLLKFAERDGLKDSQPVITK